MFQEYNWFNIKKLHFKYDNNFYFYYNKDKTFTFNGKKYIQATRILNMIKKQHFGDTYNETPIFDSHKSYNGEIRSIIGYNVVNNFTGIKNNWTKFVIPDGETKNLYEIYHNYIDSKHSGKNK